MYFKVTTSAPSARLGVVNQSDLVSSSSVKYHVFKFSAFLATSSVTRSPPPVFGF